MHLVDSLGRCPRIKPVCCLHEQAAAIAAEAYAQYANGLGVALVTAGPGATNAITGVAGAWIDSTAVLVISGQAKRADMIGASGLRQRGVQEVDIVSVVKPITKYAATVMDPKSIRRHLEHAVHLATSGRPGPVWLDIPLDVQGAMIQEAALTPYHPPKSVVLRGLRSQAATLVGALNRSERPAFLVGNGVRKAGAIREFLKLARHLKIPVLTTWKSLDFISEDDALFFGRPGSIGQRGANFVLQNSDLLIAVGARLDLPQVGYDYRHFAPAAKKVVIDIDGAEIGKIAAQTKVALPIRADAREALNAVWALRDGIRPKDRSAWLRRCRLWKERYPVILPRYAKPSKYVNTYHLIGVLSSLMGPGDVLVPGSSGSCSEVTMQAFKVKKGQRILNTPGLGAMGFGLPASIGACLAGGGRRTVSIIGDGGLQHNIQELETLARLKLPVKIFILNNNGYASIRNMQNAHFKGRHVCCDPASGLTLPDTCKVAAAYGLAVRRIWNQRRLAQDVREVLKTPGPVICDVMVDPALPTAPRLSSQVLPSGRIVSKPLEDLWPFLSKTELNSNMIALRSSQGQSGAQ